MRIIAGKHRGLALEPPQGEAIRPTSDRARQALFNILEHRFGIGEASPLHGAAVLDVFCGSGALGLEALSRGAARCIFIDKDPVALALAERNAKRAKESATSRFVLRDATRLPQAPAAATLAFLDPPYGEGLAAAALESLRKGGWLAAGAIVSLELGPRDAFALPPGFERLDERRYGKARIVLLRVPVDAG
ncbi:MAG: 16S rRNA (guanine(966)-N(2))-methyltransferase RsmD [Alphaproteobacteria bacterium]|nr:16S rRNA (guanine(966)-N(2))-methyltransferase RsmD [Alphaproteobacteria bacterium]